MCKATTISCQAPGRGCEGSGAVFFFLERLSFSMRCCWLVGCPHGHTKAVQAGEAGTLLLRNYHITASILVILNMDNSNEDS